ncbi:hypothetical protein [Mucilaginibacter agri]|uniref:Uncharacterized protein n=1 Tax=Mucilaginibacter agri TaxID=2695265 RepID=A0A966DV45_9SPHI|nr:hypothetical protein [Mucilaginibacter agri]NCD72475.1 hypothetical protein [Mucilaginibacter agri]
MASYTYNLGDANKIEQLYPPAEFANKNLNFINYLDVIRHYTSSSLAADGISNVEKIEISVVAGDYFVKIEADTSLEILTKFGNRHAQIFSADFAQKAIRGKELLVEMGVWNPMAGFKVNHNPADDLTKWHLFPPLGLNMIGQRGLLLMHYPPWVIIQAGTFQNAMTMMRWSQLLLAVGIPAQNVDSYKTIIDVNPIAAPGSGESEYPNDYFPIMMASGFFDGSSDRDYIRSMLDLYLTPPDWPESNKYTLPILICGSPLYDPQAPGWFRVTYKNILPTEQGIPQVNVLQTGTFRVHPDSKRETPYMIANHMIAAGVTGACTNNPAAIPDIRQYEAQDLTAATFLKLYADDPNIDPAVAKAQACNRWYGNEAGTGAPLPPDVNDQITLCAMAQMDSFFEPTPSPHPRYTFEEGCERCKSGTVQYNPCGGSIAPPPRTPIS